MQAASGVDHDEQAVRARPSLYVVATPMGNLADITLRALDVLKRADAIAAEDTRVTARLLQHYGLGAPLIALHEHNERRAAERILQVLAQGGCVALVTDAGTPGISDPGAVAVCMVREAGYPVVPVPGANAAICALSASGRAVPHFLFYGFLPQRGGARRGALEELKALPHLLVFYEAPHRVLASVSDMAAVLGGARTITIARELTKLFETIHTCELSEASTWLAADANRVKGEFVLLVSGAEAEVTQPQAAQPVLEILLRELPLKQAVKLAAQITGVAKNDVYELALQLRDTA